MIMAAISKCQAAWLLTNCFASTKASYLLCMIFTIMFVLRQLCAIDMHWLLKGV
jgi:hypothetical protein